MTISFVEFEREVWEDKRPQRARKMKGRKGNYSLHWILRFQISVDRVDRFPSNIDRNTLRNTHSWTIHIRNEENEERNGLISVQERRCRRRRYRPAHNRRPSIIIVIIIIIIFIIIIIIIIIGLIWIFFFVCL